MPLFLILLIMGSVCHAKLMQIPENCLTSQKSPCLTKSISEYESIIVSGNVFHMVPETIIQWDQFTTENQMTILGGSIHIDKIQQPFKINQVLLSQGQYMITRKQNNLRILDLDTFLLSKYSLSSIQANSVLEKSVFLEKVELIPFVAQFFDNSEKLKGFLKTIKGRWKAELSTQAAIQTKVLKRAIASDENALRSQQLAEAKNQQAQKKIRKEFFYRTFYR